MLSYISKHKLENYLNSKHIYYVYVFHGEFQSILYKKYLQQNGDVLLRVLVQGIKTLSPTMKSHELNPKAYIEFLLRFPLKSLECLGKVGAMENLIHF